MIKRNGYRGRREPVRFAPLARQRVINSVRFEVNKLVERVNMRLDDVLAVCALLLTSQYLFRGTERVRLGGNRLVKTLSSTAGPTTNPLQQPSG